MAYLPVRSGSDQIPRWPGSTIEPNLNPCPLVSSVESPRNDLMTATSPWFTTSIGHALHLHQERVQQVRAVQQRVVLQPDLAAVVEERLEVLVVVVQVVLAAEQQVDDLGRRAPVRLHLLDVGEAAEAARDVARGQRVALLDRHDADVVLVALGGDADHLQLAGHQPERFVREGAGATSACPRMSGETGTPNVCVYVSTRKPTGWIGTSEPGGSTGRWTPCWPPCSTNARTSAKSPNSGGTAALFAPAGSELAHLGDHDADAVGRDLDPWVLLHG